MRKAILILDNEKYKEKQTVYEKILKKYFDSSEIVYTEYEDTLIRKVRKIKVFGKALQHILYWKKSFSYARAILKNSSDSSIICLNPIVGSFLGKFNKKNKFDLYLCGFLFEPKNNKIYYNARKKFVNNVLSHTKKVIVYSNKEVDYYKNIFNYDGFEFVQYGIDYDESEKYKGELPDDYIFTGGGSNRDYYTLFEAYRKSDINIPLVAATHAHCIAGLELSPNIVVKNDVVNETFGDVLKRSRFLVLSLKDADISAGHMVILQALKNNVPILVNRIKAVEDYVSDNKVLFYETGNKEDLIEKMKTMIERPSASETNIFYYENYSFECLLNRLMKLCDRQSG